VPVEISGRRIFLASPGGLEAERKLCRHVVSSFNDRVAYNSGVAFIVYGWEEVPGRLGRPQATINEFVRESDYLIMMVSDTLGSPTTNEPPFLTGIEEELIEALSCATSADLPMRDLLLLFKVVDKKRLPVPDRELREVLEFKNRIETSKEILFQRFESEEQLAEHVERNLREWSLPLRPKIPCTYPVLLSAIRAPDRSPMEQPPFSAPSELVAWAEEKASLGLTTQAEAAFAKAAQQERPEDLERYARFMRRTGQLQRAFELNTQILNLPDVLMGADPIKVAIRARALANMGLIKRKQGDLRISRELLDEAVQTAREAGRDGASVLDYALDLLGITFDRLGMTQEAMTRFEQALVLRRDASDTRGEAKSLVNLARLARRSGDAAGAIDKLKRAIGLLDGDRNEPALANALASLGETLSRESPAEAETLFKQALEINERLKNIDGISVVNRDLTLLYIAQGDVDRARKYAARTMEVSSASANREGTAVALRLLGQVEHAAGNLDGARELLKEAIDAAVIIGDPNREAVARLALAEVLAEQGSGIAFERTIQEGLEAAARAGNHEVASELRRLRIEPS
jgi:tetratricopeptide (TPR) repeat protein